MVGVTGLVDFGFRHIGWAFLPDTLTRAAVPHIYQRLLRRPPPTPGTQEYAQAYRRTYAGVILSYLLFNLVQAARSQAPNYYELLDVPFNADEGQLKTAFRGFARKNHPDKVGEQGADLFVKVRDAFDALKNPTKRFAYNRFGAESFEFTGATTEDEYVKAGLLQCTAFYLVTLFFMVVYGVLGDPGTGALWRYLLFFYLASCELTLYLQPFPTHATLPLSILQWMFPRWLPYQLASFLRQVYVAVSIAIVRVLPVVWPDIDDEAGTSASKGKQWEPLVMRLVTLVAKADMDVGMMLTRQLTALQGPTEPSREQAPYPDQPTVQHIGKAMENYIVDTRIKSHPMLASLWGDAINRRPEDAGDRSTMRGQSVGPSMTSPTLTVHSLEGASPPTSPQMASARSPSLPPMAGPRTPRRSLGSSINGSISPMSMLNGNGSPPFPRANLGGSPLPLPKGTPIANGSPSPVQRRSPKISGSLVMGMGSPVMNISPPVTGTGSPRLGGGMGSPKSDGGRAISPEAYSPVGHRSNVLGTIG